MTLVRQNTVEMNVDLVRPDAPDAMIEIGLQTDMHAQGNGVVTTPMIIADLENGNGPATDVNRGAIMSRLKMRIMICVP